MNVEVNITEATNVDRQGDPQYALGNLEQAVYSLTVGEGNVRQRLLNAHSILIAVFEDDFPEHLVEDWKWVQEQWTRFGPVMTPNGEVFLGSVENTLRRIRNRTGARIAVRLVTLRNDLRAYLAGSGND
ncbi:MAG: hypothetical protein OXI86_10455 [Candidatus Poribacteria bacterium]|nr:hypothetical protein [Candidatus Poribacteria bacterium]